ncbi:MAG: hypothetical protein WCG27_11825, partial [Pseudomonadota bacterium]
LDFAFVDELAVNPRIFKVPVYEEVLSLFASQEYLKNHNHRAKDNRPYFESLDYIDYLPQAPILRIWFKHHYNFKAINLNLRAVAQEVQGVSKLIFSHLGVGVLPEHHANQVDPQEKLLHRFKGGPKPLKNKISVASLMDRTHSPIAQKAMEVLRSLLREMN